MSPPQFAVPDKWGLCFDGNESAFCSALDLAVKSTAARPFRYIEIGLGYGDGMRAVQRYMSAHVMECRFIGVDINTCYPGAADPTKYLIPDKTEVHLCGAKEYLKKTIHSFNAAFIDGCHGAKCVESDFLGVERVIVPGGVVIFHDTDQGCQGLHFQPHCGTGIDARAALVRMGLISDERNGWKLIHETTGDKMKAGHGISIFQRYDPV